jgi:hypothetical protein
MTRNVTRTLTLAAAAVALALALPGDGRGQEVAAGSATGRGSGPRRHGNLDLKEGGGTPKGYAFLLQILPQGRAPEVSIELAPEDTSLPPDNWTWYVSNPSDNGLESLLSFKWYAQASCPDVLTLLRVSGPGGTLTQNPLYNPIWGYFNTQSFTVDTVKNVCIDWANDNTCDPAEPGCVLYETIELVGGVAPATAADRLRLQASCASGPVADTSYAPLLSVRCVRGL